MCGATLRPDEIVEFARSAIRLASPPRSSTIRRSIKREAPMWPRRTLQDLLGIEHPIIQAPMGGVTTPALAAAVSNAGALGSLSCGSIPLATAREHVATAQRATNRPINVNFFAHAEPRLDAAAAQAMQSRLRPYYDELGLGPVPEPASAFAPFDRERLDFLLATRPRVVSFHFGVPDEDVVRQLKDAGCILLSSATTVAEARTLEERGVDAVIAQGADAGGHRGTFTETPGAGTVGTMSLVPQVVDAVRVPVIAAGGIFDGRGIAAAFALGAAGVQIGTAFLSCPEASVPEPYRAALRDSSDAGTQVTRAMSGRPARVLRNRYVAEMAASGDDEKALAFPLQASLSYPLGRAPDGTVRPEFLGMWAGQGAPKQRAIPAAALVEALVHEARILLPP
jgi:nitronate monooxygenase